ncbi:MAG: gluconokinase [Dehalococcoidia bacterium]
MLRLSYRSMLRLARRGQWVIVLVTGVAGSGKSTVGALAATRLGWRFVDADDYHSHANIEKMRAGRALTEADRRPWLERLAALVTDARSHGTSLVLACSALRRAYRDVLVGGRRDDVLLVYLWGDPALLEARMAAREHFMPAAGLPAQLATLEPPEADERPLILTAEESPQRLADSIVRAARGGEAQDA